MYVLGYTIPAGWGIMLCTSAQHLEPILYKYPLKFNPWRWKVLPSNRSKTLWLLIKIAKLWNRSMNLSLFICKNLTPFGEGKKQCAGSDFAKASMCIFLHVLVSKYRFTSDNLSLQSSNFILFFCGVTGGLLLKEEISFKIRCCTLGMAYI